MSIDLQVRRGETFEFDARTLALREILLGGGSSRTSTLKQLADDWGFVTTNGGSGVVPKGVDDVPAALVGRTGRRLAVRGLRLALSSSFLPPVELQLHHRRRRAAGRLRTSWRVERVEEDVVKATVDLGNVSSSMVTVSLRKHAGKKQGRKA